MPINLPSGLVTNAMWVFRVRVFFQNRFPEKVRTQSERRRIHRLFCRQFVTCEPRFSVQQPEHHPVVIDNDAFLPSGLFHAATYFRHFVQRTTYRDIPVSGAAGGAGLRERSFKR
jgi:hypothetical protein